MAAQAVVEFFEAAEKSFAIRKQLMAAKAHSSDDIGAQVVVIAAEHGFTFTEAEYQAAVSEEYDLLFRYHRVVFHVHLLGQPAFG